jgi:hypothetical protein
MFVDDEKRMAKKAIIFLIAILLLIWLAHVSLSDQFVYHSSDGKHYLVESDTDIRVKELPSLFDGGTPSPPVPNPPNPPTNGLSSDVDQWADAVPNYSKKVGDRASLAAIYQVASNRVFNSPVEVADWVSNQYQRAEDANLLSSDWSTRWKSNFRDPLGAEINRRISSGQLSNTTQIAAFNKQVYEGLSNFDVARDPLSIFDNELRNAALTPDTILQVIQIIRDGLENGDKFFAILIKVIIFLLTA